MPVNPDTTIRQLLEIRETLARVMISDRHAFNASAQQMISMLKRNHSKRFNPRRLDKLLRDYQHSCELYQNRLAGLPRPALNADLPVIQYKDEIIQAISDNQVVIIAGETGSGKTTQLPQICLSMDRGIGGFIGHTQPRRIAARSVAQRIAEELNSELGKLVGYKVRFTGEVRQETYIKLMTDGILLAEMQRDHFLNHYDTLIIDEAHERNLNIDFILGYLKTLLPKRRDLKLIVTSATIDTKRFADHFDSAPIIEVSGRTYPVEIRYRPMEEAEELDDQGNKIQNAILGALQELDKKARGDTLVFLSGERDIRDISQYLKKQLDHNSNEILPLYARLGAKDQNRVFQSSKKRRIILSTNVAETSLTVPGIKYVIDTGRARINRYNYKTKVQRLPIEKISQANADQRKGRCGRVSEGICIRLFSEEDFQSRPLFADPEIKRVNLASVILRMKVLKLGQVEEFPFLEPPDQRYIKDGYKLLNELMAIDHHHKLTDIGYQLARMPVDPKIGRMLIEASRQGSLREVLVIASALSVQDPRERPHEFSEAADKKHEAFQDESSDFLFYLNLWRNFHEQSTQLSNNQLRKWCRENFLSYQRMREWLDVHGQLSEIASEVGGNINQQAADYANIHCALCAGLLGNIGLRKEKQDYIGARDITVSLFPGSVLTHKPPKWIVAAELIETQKLYAHTAAKIYPEWLESLAPHITKHHYSEPHWDESTGYVSALEKITLYGLPIVVEKRINYEKISLIESRELFIRAALVDQKLKSNAYFYRHNNSLIGDIKAEEEKHRVRGILVSEKALFDLYDEKVPGDICNVKAFNQWISKVEKEDKKYLCFTRQQLISEQADALQQSQRPDHLELDGIRLALEYTFDIGAQHDGVSVLIPHLLINQVPDFAFDWLVPGFLQEKIVAIIKALPKKYRRSFVPAPEYARACAEAMEPYKAPLIDSLALQLKKMTGVIVPPETWHQVVLPEYLMMYFKIVNEQGQTLASGRDLAVLKNSIVIDKAESAAADLVERSGMTAWDLEELPERKVIDVRGFKLTVFPALVDEGESVALKNFEDYEKAVEAHRRGVAKLYQIQEIAKIKYVGKNLQNINEVCANFASRIKCESIKQGLLQKIVTESLFQEGVDAFKDIRSQEQFIQNARNTNARITTTANEICSTLLEISRSYKEMKQLLARKNNLGWLVSIQDMQSQLDQLVYPGFIERTEMQWFIQIPKYLKGISIRINKLEQSPQKDQQRQAQLAPFWEQYIEWSQNTRIARLHNKALSQYHWMLQEMRISLFCQELGTTITVSLPRLTEVVNEFKNSLKQNKTVA